MEAAYGRDALVALCRTVEDAKADDALAPATLVVPNNIAGIVARRHLAELRRGIAALTVTTLPRLAEQIAVHSLTRKTPATNAVVAAAWRAALNEAPGIFDKVAHHPSTVLALSRAHRSLRDLDGTTADRVLGADELGREVLRLHRTVVARLADRWYDQADVLAAALETLRLGGEGVDALGQIIVYLPQDLSAGEVSLLAQLRRCAPVT